MDVHLYLSMVPEALVASMLPPEEFGRYLAVGTQKRSRGNALYFEIAEGFRCERLDIEAAVQRCVPHESGGPKHSVYASIYRVLERVPLDALGGLWLVTADGRGLRLEPSGAPACFSAAFHLYREVCPVNPLIASTLPPPDFARFITDESHPIATPRICFVDLELSELASDPENGRPIDLPYPRIEHVRDCLLELQADPQKHTKTVDRCPAESFPFRCIKSGFYVGDPGGVRHYPFPSHEELEKTHHKWWRSAGG